MIEEGDEIVFQIHAKRPKSWVSGRWTTRHDRFSIRAIFLKELRESLYFRISEDEWATLRDYPKDMFRVEECEGLDFSDVKNYFQKPELEAGKYHTIGTVLIIPEPRNRFISESNQQKLIAHLKQKQTRKLAARTEERMGQPLQKYDPAAEGGAM